MKNTLKSIGKQMLGAPVRRWLLHHTRWPPVNRVSFNGLRRVKPVSRSWGGDRGLPIDRYYIEQFLATQAADIQGRVLEIGDNVYTLRFGGDQVTRSDIVHVCADNPKATFVADLTKADHLPTAAFDCIICTQTLQQIFDMKAVAQTLYRLLKSDGVLLVTFPGISQIDRDAMNQWGDYWRLTTLSARRLFEELFQPENIEIKAYGNVLAAIAFLHGLAREELTAEELNELDDDYQVLITVRAVKSGAG